jgi:non-ribosomal peptide synthase protein (TIGR01720 family)
MVPAAFVRLESLPLSPNGKLDRKALPAPNFEAREAYERPRSRAEETLARIWSEVLGAARVGVHDNFFELGGDSILSIQIVSRANRAGLRLTTRQMFEHQTVAELAAVAAEAAPAEPEGGPVTGEVPLTPVQRWFFDLGLEDVHHFNQALLLELRQPIRAEVLEGALVELERHHDALRLRYERTAAGWSQTCLAPGGDAPFRRIDLGGLGEEEQRAAIEAAADEAQRSLDLTAGPLWRAVLFERGERTSRLLWVIHHLAVDGVSWRVLMEDLETACARIARGERAGLAPRTTSFVRWSERLLEHARAGGADGERDYWREVCRSDGASLPIDHPEGRGGNTAGSVRRVTVVLDAEETRALLQEVPAAYRTRIDEVLLAAVVDALAGWTGRPALVIDVEGHGREELFEGVDLTRTVGWFTAIHPVRLRRHAGPPGELLKGVKEQLRQVPRRGIGYGVLRYLCDEDGLRSPAEVSFNYLGRLDPPGEGARGFAFADEGAGPSRSERGRRSHLIDVSGLVANGRLRMDWVYSKALHDRATMERVARRFEESLRGLIEHCRSGVRGYTPSDFPLAGLDSTTLERVLQATREGKP